MDGSKPDGACLNDPLPIDWDKLSGPINRDPIAGSSREYIVLCRREANNDLHPAYDEPHILISIVDPEDSHLKFGFNPHREGILRLQFDDVSYDDPRYKPFTKDMARSIATFVMLSSSKRIVVHCFAGISRSAATVVGIASFYGDHEVVRECHDRYLPNRLVSHLVFEAMKEIV